MIEPAAFTIQRDHWEQMLAHLRSVLPAEGCGLLAGAAGCSTAVFPVLNLLQSPVRFRMDPQQQAEAFIAMQAQDWDLLAIYHSHPNGPAHPSATDLAEFYYPESFALIWSPESGSWECRGFTILDGVITPVGYRLGE